MLVSFYYPSSVTMDYNDYYKTSSGDWFYSNYNGYFNDLSSWNSQQKTNINWPHDTNSVSTDPGFISNSDLHIIPPGSPMMAPALSDYLNLDHDVDGYSRDTSGNVMIGADQLPPYDLDVTELNPVVAKPGNNKVSMTVMNKGLNAITSNTTLYFEYSVDGGSWIQDSMTLASNINIGDTITHFFSTKWNVTNDTTYNLCVKINPQINQDPDAVDSMCQNVRIGMGGVYTINPSGNADYIDFATAVSDLNLRGIYSAVTFNVASATYNERIELQEVCGASATNTISFIGSFIDSVTLQYSGDYDDRATVLFDGADYFVFKNMTIQSTGSSYGTVIHFMNQADYNTIDNCELNITSTSTSSYLNVIVASSYESNYNGTANNANYNTIENCKLNYGYNGIYFNGSDITSPTYGNKFIGNTFKNQYYYGIYINNLRETEIKNNIIQNMRYDDAYGIYTYYSSKSNIEANIINPGIYGMYLYKENYYYQIDSSLIINNIINNFSKSTNQTGISLSNCFKTQLLHNSIWINPTSENTSYADIYLYYNDYPTIKNNILYNTGNSPCIYSSNNILSNNSLDYNDYYSTR